MRRLFLVVALALVATLTAGGTGRAQTTEGPPEAATGEDPTTAIEEVRAARQTAWLHRLAGDHVLAAQVAEQAIERADQTLGADLDMASRRTLVDLKSSLVGLRDAARRELEAEKTLTADGADPAAISGNIEPQINPDVLRWVEYYTGAGRSTFERWLKRSGRYFELFRSVLRQEGLPPELVNLVFVESGFNVHARSVSAAVGPWQFIRSTARLFGLTVNQWVDERKDPEKATIAAARYLKHLYSIFGDWPLALASYNAGEGAVLRAMRRQGTSNYWDLRLPRQTEEYVPQFMAILAISRDPARYGFDKVPRDEPIEFDEVALRGAVDLRALAKVADCSIEDLRVLNPAVRRDAARGPHGVTMLRVPRGKGGLITERLTSGESLPATRVPLKHKVQRGETLSGIAGRHKVSVALLAERNGIRNKHKLRIGDVLTVPGRFDPPQIAELEESDPRVSTAYVPEARVRAPAPVDAESVAEGRYTVRTKRGDTLGKIAAEHGVSVAELKAWNHLKTTRLRRGQRLKIRPVEAADATEDDAAAGDGQRAADASAKREVVTSEARSRAAARFVVVNRGDTLTKIAREHGVTVRALKRANGLRSDNIRPGQKLQVPTS